MRHSSARRGPMSMCPGSPRDCAGAVYISGHDLGLLPDDGHAHRARPGAARDDTPARRRRRGEREHGSHALAGSRRSRHCFRMRSPDAPAARSSGSPKTSSSVSWRRDRVCTTTCRSTSIRGRSATACWSNCVTTDASGEDVRVALQRVCPRPLSGAQPLATWSSISRPRGVWARTILSALAHSR